MTNGTHWKTPSRHSDLNSHFQYHYHGLYTTHETAKEQRNQNSITKDRRLNKQIKKFHPTVHIQFQRSIQKGHRVKVI